jgi:CRISPR-associated endonuclease/helicase Cas3
VHIHRLLRKWGASRETSYGVAMALGGHHGIVPTASSMAQARMALGHTGGERWASWCDDVALCLTRAFVLPEPSSLPWRNVVFSVEALIAFAALTTVSDWIASSRAASDNAGTRTDVAEYVRDARALEARKVDQLGFAAWAPPADTRFAALFSGESEVRPLQSVLEASVERVTEPGIWVISAPTGEGKTKAALQAVATLVRRLGMNGFYVAMPTRASSNQAFTVADQLPGTRGKLRLVHSSALDFLKSHDGMRASAAGDSGAGELDFQDIDRDGCGVAADDEAALSEAEVAREWFTGKRGLLGPMGVGTVDQALMAATRSRHVFVRLAALSGKVLVFDEVHGYDVHMSTLFHNLLWWLGRFRVPVILLSATLSTGMQQTLISSWREGAASGSTAPSAQIPVPAPSGVLRAMYPRIARARVSGVVEPASFEVCETNRDRRVELSVVAWEQRLDWVVEQVLDGQCVAVVHNVVQRAVDDFAELKKRFAVLRAAPGEVPMFFLLHGDLDAKVRSETEAELRRLFGPDDARGRHARPTRAVVVGTQVLEESLDLDFDTMITSLAPIDGIIQRMGRIQRHRAPAQRTALRLALTGVWEGSGGRICFPPHTTKVYAEAVLLRTWALLRNRAAVVSPSDIQGLIDLVYDDLAGLECPPEWRGQWDQAHAAWKKMQSKNAFRALGPVLPRVDDPLDLSSLTFRAQSARQTRRSSGARRET